MSLSASQVKASGCNGAWAARSDSIYERRGHSVGAWLGSELGTALGSEELGTALGSELGT